MSLWEGVSLAMAHIRTQKLKSFFSVLGVIIGVMFLIAVVSIVEGMDRYVREDLSSEVFGINTVSVDVVGTVVGNLTDEERRALRRRPPLTTEDADALRERLVLPNSVTVQVDNGATISNADGLEVENAEAIAGDAPIFEIRGWEVARGRPFTTQEADRGSAVVVIGSEVADILFEDADPIGQRVQLRGYSFRVIGVLESMGSIFGQSRDNKVIGPFGSPLGRALSPRGYLDEVIVQAASPDFVAPLRDEVEGVLRVQRRLRPREASNFSVETQDQSLSFWENISRILFIAFPMLVAISLVVGGIVIMNIMLVSVMERTREIGVRKALGAKRRDILTQVLIESSTLSLLGALIGVALGAGLSSSWLRCRRCRLASPCAGWFFRWSWASEWGWSRGLSREPGRPTRPRRRAEGGVMMTGRDSRSGVAP